LLGYHVCPNSPYFALIPSIFPS